MVSNEILSLITEYFNYDNRILRNCIGKIEDVKNKITISIDIDEINTVIFDEVHYMGDKYRGMVWEECFILLPKRIRLISLSATIENPEHFAQWLADIKQTDVVLTKTHKRVVPLRHSLYLDYLPSFLNKDKMGDQCRGYNNKPIVFSDEKNPLILMYTLMASCEVFKRFI